MTSEQKTGVVWLVSIPAIPRRGILYEDIDAVYTQARRVFNEDQADRFKARVELYECIKEPTCEETLDFQNEINAINNESWPVYTRAPPDWKPAQVVKHDNSRVKLMPQRGLWKKTTRTQPIAKTSLKAEFTYTDGTSSEVPVKTLIVVNTNPESTPYEFTDSRQDTSLSRSLALDWLRKRPMYHKSGVIRSSAIGKRGAFFAKHSLPHPALLQQDQQDQQDQGEYVSDHSLD